MGMATSSGVRAVSGSSRSFHAWLGRRFRVWPSVPEFGRAERVQKSGLDGQTRTGRPAPGGWEHGDMSDERPVVSWLTDMDGVLVHEETAIPGATEFLARLQERGLRFLV